MYQLGEVVPTFMPHDAEFGEDYPPEACKSTLYFTFNCASGCLGAQIPSRNEYPSKPLILVITAFLIRRNGDIARPIREFTRNFLISVKDVLRDALDAALDDTQRRPDSSSADGAHVRSPSPSYRPSSPSYLPSRPVYEPSTSGSTQTRRTSKRKNSVRFK